MITESGALPVAHVVAGRIHSGRHTEYRSRDTGAGFVTPRLDLNELVTPRATAGPAFDMPIAQVYDFLEETGRALRLDRNAYLQAALEAMTSVSTLSRETLTFCYARVAAYFSRASCEFQVEHEIGVEALDGWQKVSGPDGSVNFRRAFPPRLIHLLAGNSPDVSAVSILRGALTKGVHLMKMASNDLYTATAILRTMADIDPDHPIVRSFSAVYWRGGDERIENALFRAQYFDKLIAWGGGQSIRHAMKYISPGFELISYDPKTSISLIGQEAFASSETLLHVADLAASDASIFEQDACSASRFQFVEGDRDQVDRYCEVLVARLGVARPLNRKTGRPTPRELRDEVEGLRDLAPTFRVWGDYAGNGLVIRSDEPVDFHPDARTVNVVPVQKMLDAARFVNVSTQTIGVFPTARQIEVRDAVAAMGGQRVLPLGNAADGVIGLPHDAMYTFSRVMKWVVDMRGGTRSA